MGSDKSENNNLIPGCLPMEYDSWIFPFEEHKDKKIV
jgi:hypothetical protein